MNERTNNDNKNMSKFYMERVIGSNSYFDLVKYEFIVTLFNGFPGATGILLRKLFYPSLFKKVGHGVVIGKDVCLRGTKKITLGDNIIIDDYSVLDVKGLNTEGIIIDNDTVIERNCIIKAAYSGFVIIGKRNKIAPNVHILGFGGITIGDDVLFGNNTLVVAYSHVFSDTSVPIANQGFSLKGITIKDNVWIGSGVRILDGVTINKGSIIGANAVVNKDVPAGSIVGGVPAKVLKKRGDL